MSRRRGKRQRQRDAQLLGLLLAVGTGIAVVVAVVHWLLVHWWVLVVVLVLAVFAGAGWLCRRQEAAAWERVMRLHECPHRLLGGSSDLLAAIPHLQQVVDRYRSGGTSCCCAAEAVSVPPAILLR
ncbi:hypothetical protein ACFC09_45135 [Streptomyces sp. NPDC056161]|uniref:hypothetical protein n=1 Tax=Streptomyces sp. NPDC056161 TaxID=3345732 RepID=UPI0035D9904A